MATPLYQGTDLPARPREGHRGLWHERFFNGYAADWTLDNTDQTAKKAWLERVADRSGVGDKAQIEAAALRLMGLCTAMHGETRVYTCQWHFATGLGNPHPVENGFLWHPVLGTPYLAGSAVKGLVRAWLEGWQSFESEDARNTLLRRWFGSTDKDPRRRLVIAGEDARADLSADTAVGSFIFFDALPIEPVRLKCDVMTPHLGKWYEQGGEITDIDTQPDRIPADWHDPVPIHFLVADRPRLQFGIAPRTKEASHELPKVLAALEQALQWLGAGAKTAAGYGVMTRDTAQEERLRLGIERAKQQAESSARERERAARHATMTPEQLAIEAFSTLYEKAKQERNLKAGGTLGQRFTSIIEEAQTWPVEARTALIELLLKVNKDLEGNPSKRKQFIATLEP